MLSEKIPIIKKNAPNRFIKKKFLKNKVEQMRIIIPPQRGGDFSILLIKFLCSENDTWSMRILFLLNIKIVNDDIKRETRHI